MTIKPLWHPLFSIVSNIIRADRSPCIFSAPSHPGSDLQLVALSYFSLQEFRPCGRNSVFITWFANKELLTLNPLHWPLFALHPQRWVDRWRIGQIGPRQALGDRGWPQKSSLYPQKPWMHSYTRHALTADFSFKRLLICTVVSNTFALVPQ